jgi:cytochrome P450
MRSDALPPSEKETKRLADEAMVILIAGSETTASTLVAILYHMLSDRDALDRLRAELATVMSDKDLLPSAAKLDRLEFLNAVIQEAIRLYPGATHQQNRVAPDEDLVYSDTSTGKTYVIPKGTNVGMSAPITNRDRSIFGDRADEFDPDRFIRDPRLKQHVFSFSKGGRQCIGMSLAYQELQTFTAGILHKYDLYDPELKVQKGPTLELFETGREDVAMWADYVTPAVKPGSEGFRVIIRES